MVNDMQTQIELEKNNTTIIHSTIPYRHLKNPKILHQVIVKKLPNGAIAASGSTYTYKVIISNDHSQEQKYFFGTFNVFP
jgi:hypothetical protein